VCLLSWVFSRIHISRSFWFSMKVILALPPLIPWLNYINLFPFSTVPRRMEWVLPIPPVYYAFKYFSIISQGSFFILQQILCHGLPPGVTPSLLPLFSPQHPIQLNPLPTTLGERNTTMSVCLPCTQVSAVLLHWMSYLDFRPSLQFIRLILNSQSFI